MAIQYFQYQLFNGTQPVEDILNQPNVTRIECGIWMKNGIYIGYLEANSQADADTAINNFQTKFNLVKKTTTEVETLIDSWWIGITGWNAATTVGGYVEKTKI